MERLGALFIDISIYLLITKYKAFKASLMFYALVDTV